MNSPSSSYKPALTSPFLYKPAVTDTLLCRPTVTDTLLYRPTVPDRYGLRPLTASERLDLARTEEALERSRSRERLELEHLRALNKSRELAKLELELETKRRDRLAREQLENVKCVCLCFNWQIYVNIYQNNLKYHCMLIFKY